MSYDIYFIKKADLSAGIAQEILEREVTPTDSHFISNKLMNEIKDALKAKGLAFEVYDDGNYLELNFPTYQVAIFNSQIAISIPYWDSNKNDGINREIKLITNVLLENGFVGFDPQTEKIIKEKFEFNETFVEAKDAVDQHRTTEGISGTLVYYAIGLGIILILIAIIWKLRK